MRCGVVRLKTGLAVELGFIGGGVDGCVDISDAVLGKGCGWYSTLYGQLLIDIQIFKSF